MNPPNWTACETLSVQVRFGIFMQCIEIPNAVITQPAILS